MEQRRTLALLVGALLLAAALSAGSGAARPAAGATAGDDTIDQRFVLALSPEPGEIDVRVRYRVPDDVTSLRVELGEYATVRSTDGFQRTGQNTYEWTRSTDAPAISYALSVNRTIERGSEGAGSSGYLYVDAGDWAIAPAPTAELTYSGFGQQPAVDTTYGFESPGATGGDMVYLGLHEERRAAIASQELRLVVPRSADMEESPDAVFGSIGDAAAALDVGPRDAEVVAIAAPTGSVRWGSSGLQRGDSDFWVLDDRRVSAPTNVWIHEYVHTRQVYRPAAETRWTVEGIADYYAALESYRQDRIGYWRFRNHLERGDADRYPDVVLAEPSTWEGTLANYDKGALVVAALDRKIRQETDGGSTVQDVIRRVNDDGELTHSEFLSAVEAVGGGESRSFAERYIETAATPETWSEREHRRVFAEGAEFAYEFAPPYDRRGPYRTDAVSRSPTVVTGETLTLPVTVQNVGSKAGGFQAVLSADGETVDTRTGTLAPGERTTVTFERTFDEPGEVRLTVGAAAETVTVHQPAAVEVTRLVAPNQLRTGGRAAVRATVAGADDGPAEGTVTLTVDGERVASKRFTLDAGQTGTLSAEVTFDEPGEHTVGAGQRSRTLSVLAGAPTSPSSDGAAPERPAREGGGSGVDGAETPTTGQPGFGVGAAAAALVAGLSLLGRRD